MRINIQRIAYAMLILSLFVGENVFAANRGDQVVVEGDRLTVHTEGVPLGELLTVIENMTGIQFAFDELTAAKKIFLDFNGLDLSEGIKKIVRPLSFAAIYDGTGKLRKVIILGRWKGSGMEVPRQEGNDFPGGPKPGPSDSIFFTPQSDSSSSAEFKGPPSGKRPVDLNESPVDTAYSSTTPPNTQDELPEDLPIPRIASSVHLPIPDSEGVPVEGPPVGKADSGSTPPDSQQDSQDEIGENLPIPGVTSPDHVPIPDYEGL